MQTIQNARFCYLTIVTELNQDSTYIENSSFLSGIYCFINAINSSSNHYIPIKFKQNSLCRYQ